MAVKLERQQVAEALQKLGQWTLQGNQIERLLTFENFVDAMIFVNKVAEIAEEEAHHPGYPDRVQPRHPRAHHA